MQVPVKSERKIEAVFPFGVGDRKVRRQASAPKRLGDSEVIHLRPFGRTDAVAGSAQRNEGCRRRFLCQVISQPQRVELFGSGVVFHADEKARVDAIIQRQAPSGALDIGIHEAKGESPAGLRVARTEQLTFSRSTRSTGGAGDTFLFLCH